jgi:ribosome-binding factor A
MPNRRHIQVAEEIQQIVSYLIQRELKDPRIGFATITNVEVTTDLRFARIYVSVMGSEEERKDTMAALQSARGFVRHEVATRMTTRTVPEIQFKLDRGLEYSDQINRLLSEIKVAEATTADNAAETEDVESVTDGEA